MSNWQPIETAPKGMNYLVFQPEHKSGRLPLPPRICLASDAGPVRQSTHWMPLPDPPELVP